MKKMIVRRLLIGLVIMLAAALLSFSVLYAAPGSPAENILRQRYGEDPSYQEIQAFMEQNDLNKPVLTQLTQWLYMVFRFDFGTSLSTNEPVIEEFFDRFGATLQLALVSLAISAPLAIVIGTCAAARKNGIFDHVSRFFTLLGISIPDFWLGLILMILFSRTLHLLPSFGYGGPEHMVMPVITMVVGHTASLSRITRSSVLETMSSDYILSARGNGLKERLIVIRYALRNALAPIVTALGGQLGHMLAGAVVVETVFGWPGIGKFLVDAIYAKDYPVIQGFIMIIAFMYVVINLLTDILYVYIDPRIRYEKG